MDTPVTLVIGLPDTLLAGQRLDESLLRVAGDAARADVDPLSDHRGSAAYKREMAAVMVVRALTQAWEAARRAMVRGAR